MKMNRLLNLTIVSFLALLMACGEKEGDRSGFEKAALVAQQVNGENLMNSVAELVDTHLNDTPIDNTECPPGDLFPTDHLTRDAAVGYISEEFRKMGYIPDTAVLGEGAYITYNVFAEWPGTSDAEEVILVGSHLDAFYGGADDNTTAVAAMLEAARIARNFSFSHTIRFIAFDLEELGSMGSTRYVEAGLADDVKTAIVMDLIGYRSFEPGSQKNVMGIRLPDVGDYLMVIGNKDSEIITRQITDMANCYSLSKALGVLAPGDGAYFLSQALMRSDHGLLWYKGIPAVFLTDGANFRNPNYHLASDLPETIDADFLTGNTKVLMAAIALLAEVQQ
ncbi:MAG: M20/M25/M40 family metallo-hydrolase [Bacteroidales bacterium]|nr:M20/M25/M40 family metallo-hydrolase [Bacteroidales bacterium]